VQWSILIHFLTVLLVFAGLFVHVYMACIGLGIDSGDKWVEVTEGLGEGERVVVSSQFLIDSESKLKEALQMFQDGSGSDAGAMKGPAGSAAPSGGHAGHEMP